MEPMRLLLKEYMNMYNEKNSKFGSIFSLIESSMLNDLDINQD